MKKKKIPHFKSAEEEAVFWETHDLTENMHLVRETDTMFVLSPELSRKVRERAKRRMISIRLAEWEISTAKEIAKKRDIPYQILLREWIDQGIRASYLKKYSRKAA